MNAERIGCSNGRRGGALKSSKCSGSMPIAAVRGAIAFTVALSLTIVLAFATVIGGIVRPPAGLGLAGGRWRTIALPATRCAAASCSAARLPLPSGVEQPR